jgi:type II secretory pathway component GspD/PulD (secretin)
MMHNEWIRLISATGVLGLAAIAPADGMVTGLTATQVGTGVKLKVSGTDLPQPRIIKLLGGKDYILQFDASMRGRNTHFAVDKAGVKSAKLVWYTSRPPAVRVMLTGTSALDPTLERTDGGYTISVGVVPEVRLIAPPGRPIAQQASPNLRQAMPQTLAMAAAATPTTTVAKKPTAAQIRVSLDFVNTDVVQILKALALQADVNIVTSPDVQGRKITVSLNKVTVTDALDFVTALAGLRYAQVQDSFVVASRESFPQITTDLGNREMKLNTIRVVPIVSGDGAGIRGALSKWFAPTTLQVLLPGEDKAAGGAASAPQGGAEGGKQPAGGAASAPTPAAGTGENPSYLTLIGDRKWVDQAEALVKQLDSDVVEARTEAEHARNEMKANADKENEMAAQTKAAQVEAHETQMNYVVQNGTADDLRMVVEPGVHGTGVSIVASPAKSNVQTLVVAGPEDRVRATMNMLQQLDTGAGMGQEFVAYDIKYADPRSLRESLVASVPGITVTIPPSSAGNPAVYKANAALSQVNQSQQAGQGNLSQAAQSTQSGQAGAGTSQAGGGTGSPDSLALPYAGSEAGAAPMRLMLKGSKSQLDRALDYLRMVDIAPKQLAIEMRVMELSKEDALKLGINWNAVTGGTVKSVVLNESQGGIGSNTNPANVINGRIGGNGGYAGVTASLDAIANNTNLISRPNLLCLDGRESEIFVGDHINYVESIVTSQTGPTITSNHIDVGVRLSVLPRIGGDGNITMDLQPVVSTLTGFTSTQGTGVSLNLPQTSVRIAQCTVNLHSGDTLALGGLIQDQDQYDIQKVPILGDIPIIGHLFRSTTHDRSRKEVVFFLTVREIDGDNKSTAGDPRSGEKTNPAELPIPKRNLLK